MTVLDIDSQFDTRFDEIVDDLTRRGFLAGGLTAAAVLGLAACGSDGTSDSDGTTGPSTRVVDSAKGKITVPAHPKRVVAMAYTVGYVLFDLGVTPAGVQDPGAEYVAPRYSDLWGPTPKINPNGGELNVEKIAALNPDLIIGVNYAWNTDLYDQMKAIAPTVIVDTSSWEEGTAAIADALNLKPALAKLEKRFADRTAEIKSTYADVLGRFRWDLLQGGFTDGQFWTYGANSTPGQLFVAAGGRLASASTAAAASTDPGVGVKPISYENIDQLKDADVIAYYATYDDKPINLGPALFKQKLWQELPAVKAGRLVPVPDFLVGCYGDALAALDEFEAGLKKIQEAS